MSSKTRDMTASDLARHLGCRNYIISHAMPKWRITAMVSDGVYWVATEDACGIVDYKPHTCATAAMDAVSNFVESKQEDN